MLHDQLKELKNRKNLTAQEIADRSGVPLSTVNKILSGQTDNPAFRAVCDMVKAMGGSVDELVGISRRGDHPSVDDMADAWVSAVRPMQDAMDEKDKEIQNKDKWINRLFWTCLVLFSVLVFFLAFDLFSPNVGWIRG